MRKLNYTGKICVVLCAILCVGSLSGCSTAMQSLADGTDAVLNGLADGTDIVLNGLSEGADQALGGLSEADDGQAKDSIVNAFGEAGARSRKYNPHHLFTFSRKRRSSSFSSLRGR